MTADAEEAGAGVVRRANLRVVVAAHLDDVLHVAERLHVVHDGRTLVEAEHGGKIRRLDARVRPLALERFDQARLLAADVGAGTAVHENVATVVRPENLRPDEICRARLGDGVFQDPRAVGHLAADIDVRLLHVVRPGGDHDPLDQLVRVLVNDVAVLERARLGFVRVDDKVDWLAALAVDEPPLHAARETRAAATPQPGAFHLVDDRRRLKRDGLLQHLVAAMPDVARQVIGITGLVDVLEDDPTLLGSGHGWRLK